MSKFHGINNLDSLRPCGLGWQFRSKINNNITLKQMKILYKMYKFVPQNVPKVSRCSVLLPP
jgi:hypothetical protein